MTTEHGISVEAVSNAFDRTYYRQRYPDLRADPGIDEFAHYCQIGWKEGRDPNAWFSTRLYLLAHLDVAASKLNPLIHYILRGKRDNYAIFEPLPPSRQEQLLPPEAELIRSSFDRAFYTSRNHDLGDADPFIHFCVKGWSECRDPAPWFNMAAYLARNPDVAEAGANSFIHYIFTGRSQRSAARPKRRLPPNLSKIGDIQLDIDHPAVVEGRAVEPVTNALLIAGWTIAPEGIASIEAFLDGVPVGNAHYGLCRPDIAAMYPEMPQSARPGFAISLQDICVGWHQAKVVVHDNANNVRETQFSFEAKEPTEAAYQFIKRRVTQAEVEVKKRIYAVQELQFVIILYLTSASATELRHASITLRSVRKQVFTRWRLFIVCPADDHKVIAEAFPSEPGVAIVRSIDISADVMACDGALISFLRAGDELGVDALQEMAVAANLNRNTDIFYSDERAYDAKSRRYSVSLKPDWSPDLLLSTNYIGRWWCFRSQLMCAQLMCAVGFAFNRDWSEYDLLLRLTDQARTVYHIPKVLCAAAAPTQSHTTEKRALRQALRRRGIAGVVADGYTPHQFRIKRALVRPQAMISIIIPTAGIGNLFKKLITSIRKYSSRNFEIICIDDIRDPAAKEWLHDNADVIVKSPRRFNWSRGNNWAAAIARGEYFVFLNDDMEVTDPHWLDALLEQAQRPEVGVVGPLLVYPDGSVQHAGLVLYRGSGIHAFRGMNLADPDANPLITAQREVTAVTGACMMVSRETFTRLGGFDESHAIVNNDLDFCLRCRQAGLLVIYTPHTRLTHYEEVSRGTLPDTYNASRFKEMWWEQIALGDPYSHPHLVHDNGAWRPTMEPVEALHVGHPLIGELKRILIVKLDHIGDFVTAMPSIDRLKKLFPAAELTVLVSTVCASLARSMASVDRVLEFNFFHARSGNGPLRPGKRIFADLKDRLAPYNFDIAIDLRQQFETREVLQCTGATWLAGYDIQNRFPWLDVFVETTLNHRTVPKRVHAADSLLHLVDAVALASEGNRAAIPAITQDQARKALTGHPAMKDLLFRVPLIAMQPGGGAEIKLWPAEHFAALADLLIERDGASIMLIGSEDEGRVAEKVLSKARHTRGLFSLVGKITMRELPNVLLSSDLMIGNNSGPHHLAAGLSVPTVGIHAGIIDAHEWGPLGPMAVTVGRSMHCSPCYLEKISDCHRNHACMRDVPPRDVYRVCQQMLVINGRSKNE
jgi:ADP-heptose:LPS heptosyltransferase/GT2 family glycosyltransferase